MFTEIIALRIGSKNRGNEGLSLTWLVESSDSRTSKPDGPRALG